MGFGFAFVEQAEREVDQQIFLAFASGVTEDRFAELLQQGLESFVVRAGNTTDLLGKLELGIGRNAAQVKGGLPEIGE